ncbi:hypothetical protein JCM8202_002372, partial [Rhodotorula sphaerocarpa]
EWRKNKRYVEYYESKPLSDYSYESIPVQWSSWLRRTRREPPSLEELQRDHVRQLRLQENVRRLELEYRAEKVRLADAQRAVLLPPSTAAAAAEGGVDPQQQQSVRASTDPATRPVQAYPTVPEEPHKSAPEHLPPAPETGNPELDQGLPARNGGVDPATAARAAQLGRNVGLNRQADSAPVKAASTAPAQEPTHAAAAGAGGAVSPRELAERRRKQEEDEAAARRVEFAKQNADAEPFNKAAESASQEPEGWAPSAPARRR